MKLPDPINSTNKTSKSTKSANHLFHSTVVSSCLALMACTTILVPHTQNHAANYIDPRATHQTTKDADPGYSWFY
jgi:hypothetical protein